MKEVGSYSPVILNPNIAHRELHLSEGLTSIWHGAELVAAPERMERMELGSKGFSSGRHRWEVEVWGQSGVGTGWGTYCLGYG